MGNLKLEQYQRFVRMVTLLTSPVKGKAPAKETEASTRMTPMGNNSNVLLVHQTIIMEDTSMSIRKVELPNFNGVDPIDWLVRAYQYFENNTKEEMKVQLALVYMEGPALHWMRWIRQCTPQIS